MAYTARVVDRSLVESLQCARTAIRLAGPDAERTVPPVAQAMFTDPVEQLVYRIIIGDKDMAGEHGLPLQGDAVTQINGAHVFDARYGTSAVRNCAGARAAPRRRRSNR